jgi:hypothetical protein
LLLLKMREIKIQRQLEVQGGMGVEIGGIDF